MSTTNNGKHNKANRRERDDQDRFPESVDIEGLWTRSTGRTGFNISFHVQILNNVALPPFVVFSFYDQSFKGALSNVGIGGQCRRHRLSVRFPRTHREQCARDEHK